MMICKFRLASMTEYEGTTAKTLRFHTQYDNTIEEDRRLTHMTPSGNIEVSVDNPLILPSLQVGQSYYVTFTPIVTPVR